MSSIPHWSDAPCKEWQGRRNPKGYAQLVSHKDGEEHRRSASRAVWEAEHGTLPDGMEVCHYCDNPPCVEISHLFAATHAMNMADMSAKGRAYHSQKTACTHGHAYTDATLVMRMSHGKPVRCCRICERLRNRKQDRSGRVRPRTKPPAD